MRPERVQDVINHANVLESRGLEHSARVPKEVFCAKARGSRLRYRRAAHYAWKQALPQHRGASLGTNGGGPFRSTHPASMLLLGIG